MRRKNYSSKFFVTIAVLVGLCVLSAVYSGVTGKPSPVTSLVSMITSPIQKLGTNIGGFFGKGRMYFVDIDEMKAENEQLKRQVREMEQQVRDAKLALEENDRLRQQIGAAPRQRDMTFATAEVIGRNPGEWAVTLTLDKGSSHGIEVDDVVTTESGMVGYVSQVAANNCEVTTVIDIEMQCGALVTRTREAAIAEGNYDLMNDGHLRLSYLKEDADVVIGDTIETSGRGGVFPKGVMIGTVESVVPEENGISYYAVIKPFVDVETVTNVSVITDYTITE